MRRKSIAWRRTKDFLVRLLSSLAAFVGIFVLGWILWELAGRGLPAFSFGFLTQLPAPAGETGGGVGNAVVGTFCIAGLAAMGGVPLGLLAGIYLSEFGRGTRLATAVRFSANVLMGFPSIIIGVFVYTLVVVTSGGFSGFAGSLALGIMMLPIVTRTTEEMLRLVPDTLRESALALGAPRWRMTPGILLRAAKDGLITGVLLAVARVSGEAAPLLFTSLNSPYWPESMGEPTANLPVTIFNFAMSPYDEWQKAAWGAALLITAGVLFASVTTRWILRGETR